MRSMSPRRIGVLLLGVAAISSLLGRDAMRDAPAAAASFLRRRRGWRRYLSDEYGERDEEEEEYLVSATILVVFLLLVLLTIGFDVAKDRIEERAGRHMRPIVESLFGELTVLGFLSACTFVLSEAGVFHFLGTKLFGADEEELLDIFELVHFALFFVMVVFVVQVLEDVREGLRTAEEWMELDRACRDPAFVRRLRREKEAEEEARRNMGGCMGRLWERFSPYVLFLPQMRRNALRYESLDDKLLFYGLRREFLLERSVDPPFQPTDPTKRVGGDFNFGRYLSLCFGTKMAHVVEVDYITWAFLALFGTTLFVILIAVKGNMVVMSWTWVGIGYVVFLYNIYLEKYLIPVRQAFATPIRVGLKDAGVAKRGSTFSSLSEDEKSLPLATSAGTDSDMPFADEGDVLPEWCSIDLDQFERRRFWLARMLSDSTYRPNRHHALFWFERSGPRYHSLILRINLVFNGMYCALLIMVFFPAMYGRGEQLHVFIVYVLMSAVPILAILFNKKHLVLLMVQVGCIGTFRLPQAVTRTNREEKTARAVRRLVIFHKLHLVARRGRDGADHSNARIGSERRRRRRAAASDAELMMEVSRTYDLFDRDGDGTINGDDFQLVMGRPEASMEDEHVKNFLSIVGSAEQDGTVSKDAFLRWYCDQIGQDDEQAIEACARFLFGMFDLDGSGHISVSEFKHAFDELRMGLSVDEAGDILNELDIYSTGIIAEEEFKHFLETYYPKELEFHAESWGESFSETLSMCSD